MHIYNTEKKTNPLPEPDYHNLDKRVSLLEQSLNNIESQLKTISDDLKILNKISSEQKGARQMRQYIINSVISFATVGAALELRHVFFR